MNHQPQDVQRFASALAAVRSQSVVTSAISVFMALVAIPLIGAPAAGVWLGVTIALRLLSSMLFSPARCRNLSASDVGRTFLLGFFGLEASVYPAYAILVASSPHRISTIVAVLVLCGAITSIVVLSQGLRALFFTISAPAGLALIVGLPLTVYAHGTRLDEALVLSGAGIVLYAASSVMWGRFAVVLQREAEARAQVEAAMAGKSAFLATVSHELRTPISAMQAGAIALERSVETPAQRSQAALILESGRMMRKLLDDLLDLAKLEAHRMTVETVAFDLREVVRSTALFWSPEAKKKGIKFRLAGAHATPRWVSGDPIRLRQVLNNLVSNALKFTEAGSVTLKLDVDGQHIRLSVIDTGPGLSEAQQGRLFEAFVQADPTVARTHGGTGLGLAISRDLACLMGGELTLESQLGVGTAFSLGLNLPRAEAPAARHVVETSVAHGRALRVLAADDHEINRKAIALLLEGLEVDLQVVEDGSQALEALAGRAFDIVLLDVNMPGCSGLEVARRTRARPGPNATAPIIGVTGAVEEGDIRRCLEAGMTSVVAKPIEPAALFSAIDHALSGVNDTQNGIPPDGTVLEVDEAAGALRYAVHQ